MYGYIKGIVTEIESSYIILDNNDIGYVIYTSNPYSFGIGNEYKVFIYNHVREDEISLYGFKEKEELEMFLKLISVKGLGPKMALPFLATGSISGIVDAIERENILYLKKIPKIGDKIAKQIVLDLKGKFKNSNLISELDSNDDLIEALLALGYKHGDIKRILPKVNKKLPLEDQIKESLKLLLR